MYPWYMESIWYIFGELYAKGCVYQGVKVMPYSTACNTPLSNFESGQNYKDVVDPAVVVTFPIVNHSKGASFLAWTTTPWTLPSNLALCVNANMIYCEVLYLKDNKIYIVMKTRLQYVFGEPTEYAVLSEILGSMLAGMCYVPLFSYFVNKFSSFRVLSDNYVTSESGTGVVHQAPYFGEDDYRVCIVNGVIFCDQDPICPVDASGKFTDEVTDFKGMFVKDADKYIIQYLHKSGRLFSNNQIKHSYPFCWRSETPLIYKAVPSWFIRVENICDKLLANSSTTHWVPDFVRDKRFGNWLKEARDWAVSRNRYWGTPIPIWMSDDGVEIICVRSIAELERLTGASVKDLHREHIDPLTIPSSRPGMPPLRRIPEVFDCWFESGSMPYAQCHFPFDLTKFEDNFPADFIAEGIDQTRGWFYTLLVISTLISDKAPFLNVIANGLVLASDGQKMSKSKRNYPDPLNIVNKNGADALRLYLINSPVVRSENLRFKEEGVRDIVKDVFLPWFNAFRFLMQNIDCFVQQNNTIFVFDEQALIHSNGSWTENIMDKWINSTVQSLLEFVCREMTYYRLYTVVPRLTKVIDDLTNWYVRMNRKRFRGEDGALDGKQALTTLFYVIFNIVKLMAPFTPFLTEYMYQHLRQLTINSSQEYTESVHYLMSSVPNRNMIDENIERAVSRMQAVIELGRIIRDRKTLPIKYPLRELVVIHHDDNYITDILTMRQYIITELNVRELTVTSDKKSYGVIMRAEPDHKILGARLKNSFKPIMKAIQSWTDKEIKELMSDGFKEVYGDVVLISEVRLIYKVGLKNHSQSKYEAHSDNVVLVLLDTVPDTELINEGIAREIINRIQKLRKKGCLVPTDDIMVYYETRGELERILNVPQYKNYIETTIKAKMLRLDTKIPNGLIIDEMQKIKEWALYLLLAKNEEDPSKIYPWVNVVLRKIKPRFNLESEIRATILLKSNMPSIKLLREDIDSLFGLFFYKYSLWCCQKQLTVDEDLINIGGEIILVCPEDEIPKNYPSRTFPYCLPFISRSC